jgi:hypothetical protein
VAAVLLHRFRKQSEPERRPPGTPAPAQQLADAEELLVLGQPAG